MKQSEPEDLRRIERKQATGDILWSYATNPLVPQYEGILVDLNKFGLGIITQKPVREASILRIYAKGFWNDVKYATVMWCVEDAPNKYRSGLLFTVPVNLPNAS